MTLQGIREMFAVLMQQEIPKLALMGVHSYSVEAVQADGRCDLKAKKKGPPATIPNVDHWCGLPGGAGRPTVGSTVVLTFLDGDKNAPMVVGYQPLRLDGGKPDEVTVDGVTVKVGPHATLVELGGSGAAALALASAVASNFTNLQLAIKNTVIAPGDGGAAIQAAVTAVTFSSVATTKVKGV